MIVDRDGNGDLCFFLADDVFIQESFDLPGLRQPLFLQLSGFLLQLLGMRRKFIPHDIEAKLHALIADIRIAPGNEPFDFILAFSAERAARGPSIFHIDAPLSLIDHTVDQAIFLGFLGAHPVVALAVGIDLFIAFSAVFKCHIHEVKEKLLPEADDEFAKDVSEFDTLADFRKNIEEKLRTQKENKTRDDFLDLLLAQVVDGMKVELNDAMVDQRARQNVEEIGQRIQQQGISLETYLGWMGTNLADFTKSQRANAEKTIRQELALNKIAELENITVTDEDRDSELQKFADQYGMEIDTIKTFMDTERLDESILYKKAADLIIENATALPEPEPEKVEPAEAEKAAEAEKTEDKAE